MTCDRKRGVVFPEEEKHNDEEGEEEREVERGRVIEGGIGGVK